MLGVAEIFCLSGSFQVGTVATCSLDSDESQATVPKEFSLAFLLFPGTQWVVLKSLGYGIL